MTVQPNPTPVVDPKPGDKPPTPPDPVSSHLPGPPPPDRLEIAMKAKDDAIVAMRSSVDLLNQTVAQKDEMITQQNAMIGQMRDSLQAANEFAAERIGVDPSAPAPKSQAPAKPAQQGFDMAELQKMMQGTIAQAVSPFAQSVVNMQAHHDRTLYERHNSLRLNDDQHSAVLEVQRKYANMPYDEAIRHLSQDLTIRPDQKVVPASQVPAPAPEAPPAVPAEPQEFSRPPRQPNLLASPTTPATGPSARDQSGKTDDGVYGLGQVASAMKEATRVGDMHARDDMAAKAIGALMVDEKGNRLFSQTSGAARK